MSTSNERRHGSEVQIRWAHLRATWRFFVAEVQPKRDAIDLTFVPDKSIAIIDNRTSSEQHPLAEVYYSKRRSKDDPYRVDRVGDIPVILQSLLDMSEQQLLNTIGSSSPNPFASLSDGAEDFIGYVTVANSQLRELSQMVLTVDINQIAAN